MYTYEGGDVEIRYTLMYATGNLFRRFRYGSLDLLCALSYAGAY